MPTAQPKSNIYLFFGEDDFSLRRKVDLWKTEFAKKYSPQSVSFFDAAELGETELIKALQNQLAPSLFASKKLIIIRDGLPTKAAQASLAEFILNLSVPKDFLLVFWQTSRPDGRLGFTKKFLASGINTQEFHLPHGLELNSWLKAMAKNLGVTISDQAADLLAQYLGRDLAEEKKAGGRVIERKEAYDLWQAHSELSKLAAFNSEISPDGVRQLTRAKVPDSVFNLSDSLAAGEPRQALQSLENHLSSTNGDEKSAFIKILGLLSEQFRSLLLVSLLQAQGLDQAAMAEKLGWSTGRVFVLGKHARNFSVPRLTELLRQLLVIDQKIKTTDSDPNLLVDLLVVNSK